MIPSATGVAGRTHMASTSTRREARTSPDHRRVTGADPVLVVYSTLVLCVVWVLSHPNVWQCNCIIIRPRRLLGHLRSYLC